MWVNCKRATQPCPCGLSGDDSGRCQCSAEQIQRYRNRVSGPLLDRIDIQVEVLRPKASILRTPTDNIENSAQVRERVIADLGHSAEIKSEHVAEAIAYRRVGSAMHSL